MATFDEHSFMQRVNDHRRHMSDLQKAAAAVKAGRGDSLLILWIECGPTLSVFHKVGVSPSPVTLYTSQHTSRLYNRESS